MTRFVPKSLFGQTLIVLVAGLLFSLILGSWIYSLDRGQAVRAVGGFALAQRIANLTRLVEETPASWRERIVAGISDQTFRVVLSANVPAFSQTESDTAVSQAISEFLIEELSLGQERRPLVSATGAGGMLAGRGPMMHGMGPFGMFGGFRELQVAVPLADGRWLTFATVVPESGSGFSRQFLVSMLIMAVVVLTASAWAVRRVTAPLGALSAAAERFGRDLDAPPLQEAGTTETRDAARAFNSMQERLRRLIETRTRLLAAISHDLRTPLTLLRLRAENVEDAGERERMLAAIAEMDAMVGAALDFARDEAKTERARPTDVTALIQSIVDDMGDVGLPVEMKPSEPIILECRPMALKRALANLIENAVKYGKTARVAIKETPASVTITVDDEGPGIPETELTRVFEPFYRVEGSRSRETGGVGLGLAIALSAVEANGGRLTLGNRPEGGLAAVVMLPRS
ncbi:ATP-binding protein [Mesorhizobium qingshengii]|uniref:histidine kinase n=1 Tax=Mesorhizobium qingshengii TaxID=1165689 RepID=A0ABT4R2U2_9HYPH|nr:ATP-binding protein [Mesorhizobium qingshengii]MCZ8548150.1 ATP-binding protein [Mesorhizobium qingshengii]